MNIYGIGTDIVQIARIAKLWDERGELFAQKILTDYELQALQQQKTNQVNFLAKRFAAKEAVAKAMGTGFRDGVVLTQIGIETDEFGKPSVVLYGKTKDYLEKIGKFDMHISLADETEYVLAFVIITNLG